MEKKYLIVPGEVVSRHDGEVHHVGAVALMKLYGVSQEECVIDTDGSKSRFPGFKHLIRLLPQQDGNYNHLGQEEVPYQIREAFRQLQEHNARRNKIIGMLEE